jgi:shikimate dehydrogenase
MSVSASTRLYGVVGDPVGHSLSPLIHNRWIKEAGLDAVYVAIQLQSADPAGDLRLMAQEGRWPKNASNSSYSFPITPPGLDERRLEDAVFSGLNITLPHKAAALAAATKPSPEAKRIGAANTLVRESSTLGSGGWAAHNTDTAGFSAAFDHAMNHQKAGRVVLIGAGGAARAAALVLSGLGVELAIVNRSRANAVALANELAPEAETADLALLPSLAENADIVVNSASLGHSGASLPALPAGKGRPFFDMTYGKPAAATLDAAQAAGWAPHDGLRMLVGQAAAAFKLWFDITPDSATALAACEAAVKARA